MPAPSPLIYPYPLTYKYKCYLYNIGPKDPDNVDDPNGLNSGNGKDKQLIMI